MYHNQIQNDKSQDHNHHIYLFYPRLFQLHPEVTQVGSPHNLKNLAQPVNALKLQNSKLPRKAVCAISTELLKHNEIITCLWHIFQEGVNLPEGRKLG